MLRCNHLRFLDGWRSCDAQLGWTSLAFASEYMLGAWWSAHCVSGGVMLYLRNDAAQLAARLGQYLIPGAVQTFAKLSEK